MFILEKLPFEENALEPHISANTLSFHYGKHHQTYIDNLNKLIAGTELETEPLENIIIKTAGSVNQIGIFNNAAQVYNHSFFWKCLRKSDITLEPSTELFNLIEKSFGSLADFFEAFKVAALSQFGSGWVWLVKNNDKLEIMKTANADTPLARGLKPLFVIDVWEHAYYLDYQNKRGDYIDAVLRNLINWSFIENQL